MEKFKIEVPEGIRFISEWEDFSFANFPNKCIINKRLPGCGMTEEVIRGKFHAFLVTPRKLLGKNKWEQHKDEVYLVVNEMEKDPGIDKDVNKEIKDYSKAVTEEDEALQKSELKYKNNIVYLRIRNEIEAYYKKCFMEGKYMKIIVTYDSYRIVQHIAIELGIYELFYTVVDEFQSILHDSRFKSTTELQFMNTLKGAPNTYFVSATPMLDEYLEMLSDFKDLPYFELDWGAKDLTRVIKPQMEVYLMRSVLEKASEIIQEFLYGERRKITVKRDGVSIEVVSNEIVLYVNSVNHITSLIKKNNLTPDQVNIICADNDENRRKIQRRLGKKFDIGNIPGRGEYHKPITFCTRTSYLGADFYSTCAISYVFSDSNIDSLAVDISEDLPQIAGRQRDDKNPWKNFIIFYYRATADYRKMSGEDFKKIIERKQKDTENLLAAYKDAKDDSIKYTLAKTYQDNAKTLNYKNNYIAVNIIHNTKSDDMILVPTMNELVLVNELRAFQIQQIDYKDRFTVFNTVHSKFTYDSLDNQRAVEFLNEYDKLTTIYDKLRMLCEFPMSDATREIILRQIPDSDEVKSYYTNLNPIRLKALSYNTHKIKKELGIVTFSYDLLKDSIYSEFNVGDKLLLSDIKLRLANIYSSINYIATPKAKDLEKFFNIKDSTMRTVIDGEKKIVKYYELLSKKL